MLGVLSLIFWSLTLIISIKYLVFVMRADNKGEGGILALLALVAQSPDAQRRSRATLVALGLFGAALLYGDGMITPAISVLGAVEGLQRRDAHLRAVHRPHHGRHPVRALPDSVARDGACRIALRAGDGRLVRHDRRRSASWWIGRDPRVLAAFNPLHAVTFFRDNGWHGFVVLGSVFLVVTGGEALYADMGHFGKKPIRLAWFALVLPALLLNYLGQGAMLLTDPADRRRSRST